MVWKRRQAIKVTTGVLLALITVSALILWRAGISIHAQSAGAPTLDLQQYELTFNEEFDHLSVSSRGPGTTWIAHTPWNGDFGDAAFSDPRPDFPFTTSEGVLRIEARKDADGKWRSGLLCSRDRDGPSGQGFAQKFGYFEMRAKLPPGPGVWPAFWLIGVDKATSSAEIDVVEYYGQFEDSYRLGTIVHDPRGGPDGLGSKIDVPAGSLVETYHTYGVDIEPDWMTFYIDQKQVWRTKTRPEFQQPMYVLLNLALGSGWPIDKTPNPSYMYVDYVKVYRRR
jgi:beta-glucanase (GH16 family)